MAGARESEARLQAALRDAEAEIKAEVDRRIVDLLANGTLAPPKPAELSLRRSRMSAREKIAYMDAHGIEQYQRLEW